MHLGNDNDDEDDDDDNYHQAKHDLDQEETLRRSPQVRTRISGVEDSGEVSGGDLPIDQYREEILSKISLYPVVTIKGNSGCGKSTALVVAFGSRWERTWPTANTLAPSIWTIVYGTIHQDLSTNKLFAFAFELYADLDARRSLMLRPKRLI